MGAAGRAYVTARLSHDALARAYVEALSGVVTGSRA
jgi:hypothetical protein